MRLSINADSLTAIFILPEPAAENATAGARQITAKDKKRFHACKARH